MTLLKLEKRKTIVSLVIICALCAGLTFPVGAETFNEETYYERVTSDQTKSPSLQVKRADEKGRYYQIQLQNYTIPADGVGVSFAVWSDAEGQDDLVWYNGKNYEAMVDILKHNMLGAYYVHCYLEKSDGAKEWVGGTTFEVAKLPEYQSVITSGFTDDFKTEYQICLSDHYLPDNANLRVAVWSEENGQDDLKWNEFQVTGENQFDCRVKVADYRSPGCYYAHIYQQNSDGSQQWIGGVSFEVPTVTEGLIELSEQDYSAGTATLKITGLDSPSGIRKVLVPIWSASDQSDIVWYEAEKGSVGEYSVEMSISSHKNNWALYYAHVYVTDGNGFQKFVGGVSADFRPKYQTLMADVDAELNQFQIKISGVEAPGEIEEISCAVWSEAGGQDDLTWHELQYKASSDSWEGKAALTAIKSTGRSLAHVYLVKKGGNKVYLGGKSFMVQAPEVQEVSVTSDNEAGTFEVRIIGLNSELGVSKVEVPIWSQSAQQDICWYTADKQSNGEYLVKGTIANHKYNVGNYNIHVYVSDKNGIKTVVACTNVAFTYGCDKPVTTDLHQGVVGQEETEYRVTIDHVVVPAGAKKIEFAVWSESGGQDDVRWYTASKNAGGGYQADISIKNHKTLGKYLIHTYATTWSGNKIYLNGSSDLQISGTAKATVQVVEKNDAAGIFTVSISDLEAASGISGVRIAAWTTANGSDVAWYTAERQSNGTYQAVVNVSNHNYNLGTYTIHAYVTMGNQIQVFGNGAQYTFNPSNFIYVLKDQGSGKRTAVLKNASGGNVRFAVWSELNGQDDFMWYSGTQSQDGSWKTVISTMNHKNSGNFLIHAYSGNTPLAAANFVFEASEFSKNGWYYENGYKLYYINDVLQKDVSGIIGPQSSYRADVNRTTCTVTIYAKDGSNGYIIPVKAFACSVGLPGTETPSGTYYTQARYRWHELMGPSYGQYCTRIVGGILFHSVAGSNMTSYNLSASDYNMLGQPASHGCVRLCVRDAKWIYDNCNLGMEVRIYDSSYAGPFGKPDTIKIPVGQTWDPTDPNI